MAVDRQIVTVELPKLLLRKARALAVKRKVSLPTFLAGVLARVVKDHAEYERAKRRALAHMRHASKLGTKGRITWTRDSLNERH